MAKKKTIQNKSQNADANLKALVQAVIAKHLESIQNYSNSEYTAMQRAEIKKQLVGDILKEFSSVWSTLPIDQMKEVIEQTLHKNAVQKNLNRVLKTFLHAKFAGKALQTHLTCELCGGKFKQLATHLHLVHHISTEEYKREYPETEYFVSEDLRVRQSEHTGNVLKKSKRVISEDEIIFLKENIAHMTKKEMAQTLAVSVHTISNLITRYVTDKKHKEKIWTNEEVEFLVENYSHSSYVEIGKKLKRSYNSVVSKAHKLGLKKHSPAQLSTFYPEGAPRADSNEGKQWSENEDDYIKKKYKVTEIEVMARFLGRTPSSVLNRLAVFGISRKGYKSSTGWQKSDITYLKKHFKKKTYKEIGYCLQRSEKSVINMAQRLGLSKGISRKAWTVKEVEYLTRNYKTNSAEEIALRLKRSRISVQCKALQLGLVKS